MASVGQNLLVFPQLIVCAIKHRPRRYLTVIGIHKTLFTNSFSTRRLRYWLSSALTRTLKSSTANYKVWKSLTRVLMKTSLSLSLLPLSIVSSPRQAWTSRKLREGGLSRPKLIPLYSSKSASLILSQPSVASVRVSEKSCTYLPKQG